MAAAFNRRFSSFFAGLVLSLAFYAVASGCVVHGGFQGGVAVHTAENVDPQFSYAGNAAVGIAPDSLTMIRCPFYLGTEFQGQGLWSSGAFWTWGGQLGAAFAPKTRPGSLGFLALVDAGIPLGWDPTIRGWYLGGTIGMPISLGPSEYAKNRNRAFRFIDSRPELVPYLRYRAYLLDENIPQTEEDLTLHDVALGLAVRLRMISDLL